MESITKLVHNNTHSLSPETFPDIFRTIMSLRKRPRRAQLNSKQEVVEKEVEEICTSPYFDRKKTTMQDEEEEEEGEEVEEISTSPYFDRKKKQETGMSRRAASQARVAHNRAAHFARLPVSSSCPTGLVQTDTIDKDDKDTPQKNWPGPFSTANDMLKKREAVKLAREAAIAEKDKGKGSSSL